MAPPSNSGWHHFVRRPAALFAVWGLYCLCALVFVGLRGIHPASPDDYMRLFEVRDLLNGQSWWDVTQYRLDPPHGASMHWSRLVDIPLAAVDLPFGEKAALFAVPLFYLLIALVALRAIMLRLRFGALEMAIGLLIVPLFPLLPGSFAPGNIDHHTPQAVIGLVCAALLLHKSRRTAVAAGVLCAAWVAISIEGLPMVAALAAIYGLGYWLRDDRRLGWFLGALAIAAPLLSFATRPISAFSLPYCDILMPGHMAGFAVAAAVAVALPFAPAQDRQTGRFAGLVLLAALSAPTAWVVLGPCATDPFSHLDPLLATYWYGYITEGLPVWRQPVSVAAMLIWTILLAIGGWWAGRRDGSQEDTDAWHAFALFALAAGAYSLAIMREGVFAQLLTIPFGAVLLARYLPRARAIGATIPRIAATLACLLLATPSFASGATKWLDPLTASGTMRKNVAAQIAGGPCNYRRMDSLPAGQVLSPLDGTPKLLYMTRDTAVMASYHRNQKLMTEVLEAYIGDDARAERIVRANRVKYVVACASEPDLALYRTAAPDNFANQLVSGKVPSWLEPIPGFERGSLRVYRVR